MTTKLTRGRPVPLVAIGLICLVVLPAAAAAEAVAQAEGEANLTPFLNNVGIQRDPTVTNADFDGGGYAYSGVALMAGDPVDGFPGVQPGDTITTGGFTFTWPDRPPGATDNVMAAGQTIPVPPTPGATKIGFLGAAAGGSQSGALTLNYTFVDQGGNEQEHSVGANLGFTDWTRGLLGDAPLGPNEVVVLKTRFRTTNGGPFFFTQPHVFLVTVPLDAGMTLQSVRLPLNPAIHVFGIAVAADVTTQ